MMPGTEQVLRKCQALEGDAGQVKRLDWALLPSRNSQALSWVPSSVAPPPLGSPDSAATSLGTSPIPAKRQGKEVGEAHTAAEVAEDVIALLGEGDLVDSVADEAGFEQVAGILAGLSPVSEAFHVVV